MRVNPQVCYEMIMKRGRQEEGNTFSSENVQKRQDIYEEDISAERFKGQSLKIIYGHKCSWKINFEYEVSRNCLNLSISKERMKLVLVAF